MRTIPQGAATQCLVASHPDIEGVRGEPFADCNLLPPTGHATDEVLAEKAWEKAMLLAQDYLINRK